MLIIRRRNFKLAMLALFGLAYFSAVSTLEINPFFRSEIVLIPLQALALIYVAFGRSGGNITSQEELT
jgi:hypothetical protein